MVYPGKRPGPFQRCRLGRQLLNSRGAARDSPGDCPRVWSLVARGVSLLTGMVSHRWRRLCHPLGSDLRPAFLGAGPVRGLLHPYLSRQAFPPGAYARRSPADGHLRAQTRRMKVDPPGVGPGGLGRFGLALCWDPPP